MFVGPKISILVPLYRVERYITQCARSLFAQSYENCEFIFVDDASTDRSREILNSIACEYPKRKEQIKIVTHPKNRGVAAARNTALDTATGEYILFVDSDDWVDTDIVEKLTLLAIERDADICNTWCKSVYRNGAEQLTPTAWIGDNRSHFAALLEQSHIAENHMRAALFRRSIFEEHSLRFTEGVDFGEDYSLLPQVVYHAPRLATLREGLYYYRAENDSSYMNNIGERHLLSYLAANKIVERFTASLPDAKRYQRALTLGRVNIKKWIFRRSLPPKEYDALIFGSDTKIKYPLVWLYNKAIDSGNKTLIQLFSWTINTPMFIRHLAYRLFRS